MVVVQFQTTGDPADFNKLIRIEDSLIQGFSQNNLAIVDGHDFGSGTMNIIIKPRRSPEDAVTIVKAYLKHHEVLDKAVIAIRQRNGQHLVVWPHSYDSDFTY